MTILKPDFAGHRAALLDRLERDEAVLLFGGPHHLRNSDAEYRYRPDSDVYWLTGWEDPEVAVFLRPGEEPLTLFVQPRDEKRETWTGYRPGPEGAIADFQADAAFPIEQLPEELPRLIQGVRRLHYGFAADPDHDALLARAIHKATRAARRNGLSVPETFHSPTWLLHELRLHKSVDELALLRAAAEVSAEAHCAAMRHAAVGMPEYELEAVLMSVFGRAGSSGPGYTPIVASGANATILHYTTNRACLGAGELVLIDAGCELSYYTADITRTFPASGRFEGAARDVYQIVLEAQLASVEVSRAGKTLNDVHHASVRRLTEGMIDLGLLEGDVDERIEDDSYKRYYMHGTSHWLGLDVHDVGAYGREGEVRPLEPSMVFTIEPGLYVPATDEDAPEALRGIGVRIEDDVVVTDGDPEILSAGAPKTIEAIEALCRG